MASSLTKDSPGAAAEDTAFFGHPRGLATLFMTEMWERFSYYGMRALLVMYLVSGGADAATGSQGGGLAMTAATATAIYSVYVAMVYLMAMPGGWFGDRVWGARKTVMIASFVIVVGHLSLALPGQVMFFVGLGLVAIGSGLLKANISTMVGHLYADPKDVRRDGGFTIFYMGINLGAVVAPFAIGILGEKVNWHLGFGLAALGMALGAVQFLFGSRHLSQESSRVPNPLSSDEKRAVVTKALLGVAVVAAFYLLVNFTGVFRLTLNWVLVPIILAGLLIPVAVLVKIKRDKDLSGEEQTKMTAFIYFFAAAAIFWMIFDQGASTLSLFGDSKTERNIFGWDMPNTLFQALNPGFVMLLAPVFAAIWLALARRNREPSTIVKFAIALGVTGASFFVFLIPMGLATGGTKVTMWWLVLIFLMHTVAELCLSPVGLSLTTKMAPAKYASQMMGVFFLAVTAGDSVTGMLAVAGVDLNSSGVVVFEAAAAALAGVAIYLSRNKVRGLMGEVR
ncbi:peptide MFS transporter [Streptomyces candidus]|uniref:POT family proton-dependent oligopeptide transporter n=1 Tax=Streptomyces candidus TaxID=67283 RepID=A0A7X0LPY8_9ACTN|nr:oligopeptide:H+ symporter [Streptomyces candidus]MBB6435361.1 POT family proton-dependent oligopeptide transporter [Streptomyces candidus]GHH47785.1 MFS transporter [Streptomyces candidus]